MQQFITDRLPEIEALCRMHHVQRLSIFGSAVRDDFNPGTSDVDVRVIFDSAKIERYARNAFAFRDALVQLFCRKVDMLSSKRICNTYLKRAIEMTRWLCMPRDVPTLLRDMQKFIAQMDKFLAGRSFAELESDLLATRAIEMEFIPDSRGAEAA